MADEILMIRNLPEEWFGDSLYRERIFAWMAEEDGRGEAPEEGEDLPAKEKPGENSAEK